MKSKKETHYLGTETFHVEKCPECGRNTVNKVQFYHIGFGNGQRKDFAARLEARGLVKLPVFQSDEICECAGRADDEDDDTD